MTHLRIEQSSNNEIVTSSIITKLYELAHAGLDASSNLKGYITATHAKRTQVEYLQNLYPELTINVTGEYYVEFADPNTEKLLMSTYNISGEGICPGDITQNNIHNMDGYNGHPSITSFNELPLFTSITKIAPQGLTGQGNLTSINLQNIITVENYAFTNCTNLGSLGDTSNITSVGYQSFYQCGLTGILNLPAIQTIGGTEWNQGSSFEDCTGITEVRCGSNLTRVGYGAFKGCTSLTTFSATSTSFDIYRNAFDGCTSLTSITLPSNMTEIGHATFYNCQSLETINLDNITRFTPTGGLGENDAFYNCTNLFKNTGIVHMPNLTLITGKCFQGCSYIKMFIAENLENTWRSDYPFGNTAIEAYIAPKLYKSEDKTLILGGDYHHANALTGCSTLKVLEVGKVDRIYKQAFRQYSSLTAIVLHQQDTIVTLSDYSSGDAFSIYFPNQNIKLYVPDSMVASYQADSVWSNFTSYIAPISEYDFSDHISDSSLVSYYDGVFNSSAS